MSYKYVALAFDRSSRVAELTVRAPDEPEPTTAGELHARGAGSWALRAFRELDDALLRLRFNHDDIGVVLLKTGGDQAAADAVDKTLAGLRATDWLADEIVLHAARVLRRLDNTAKSLFAVVEPESCFAGPLFEILLAADRVYALEDERVAVTPSRLSAGALPTVNGRSRLAVRFDADPARAEAVAAKAGELLDTAAADELGLFTVLADEIDFADELRVAVEERASLSPDALTGMESNLRCVGAETCDSKIFGRLSAWQNWIFIRPNAVGPTGALSLYGRPERPAFDWRRT